MDNKKQLLEIIKDVEYMYSLPAEQKRTYEQENDVDILYMSSTFDELIEDYILTVMNWNMYMKEAVDEEDFEFAAKIKAGLEIEEYEFKRLLILYHPATKEELADYVKAISNVIPYHQSKINL